jgi:hypothetical protein
MTARPRPWLDPEQLELEIQQVLAVRFVEYREVSSFLDSLGSTLAHLEALGEVFPERGFGLFRRFVLGIGAIADRVHVDENDLGDFIAEVVDSALALADRNRRDGIERVSLLVDLVRLRAADRVEAFYFVPGLIEGLVLDPAERERLNRETAGSADDA